MGLVALADEYADSIAVSLPDIPDEDLRDGLAGALLSFFADAVAAVASSVT